MWSEMISESNWETKAAMTVMDRTACAEWPLESVTVTPNVKMPAVVGVPVTVPAAVRVRPAGSPEPGSARR